MDKKKIIIGVIILVVAIVLLLGKCTTSVSYTYKVETGDKIKVSLKTGNGYKLTKESPFEIKKDGKVLSQGMFITLDGYEQYTAAVKLDPNAKVIETKEKGEIEYTFYSYSDPTTGKESEWNYIIKVKKSDTGLLIGNPISKKSAKECFDRLTITKEK